MMSLDAVRRNFAAVCLPLLALYVFAPAVCQAQSQSATTGAGHVIEIKLQPDKETILLNEPIFISFEVKNHSPQELCVTEGGDYRNELGRPDSFRVKVIGDGGKPVPQPEVKFNMGGFLGCSRIPANGSHVARLFLPHWATFETAGAYTVNVGKSLPIHVYGEKSSWQVEADVSAKLTVVPADEKKLGEIIESLAAKMLDIEHPESGRAAQALGYIDDKRVIKYFAQALEKFSTFEDGLDEYERSRQAAAALSSFNDDAALAALEAAMGSRNQEMREDVASAFARSEHPRAPGLLLKMRGDSYWLVRLSVAHGLRKATTEETLEVLRELLKDEDERVREAARDSLKARGQE